MLEGNIPVSNDLLNTASMA